MMIKTLTKSQAVDALLADENARWSYRGAEALVEYLEELEDSTEQPMELDVVAIRCGYSEYDTAVDAATDYGWKADNSQDADDQEAAALAWLQIMTTVIEFWGGVVVESF